ncbi:uncharacterized protein LOC124831645 [Vigna umbellata]|uniref:uncharacterized protein LOC124831645 n=1 Tax=Vigna umbellata TaxID=87088 RepID=UPI001F5F2212|nr:uncharacterized protein LOC124831645 [Vigna umbellata]
MSGGVSSTASDINLPKEKEIDYKEEEDLAPKTFNKSTPQNKVGFLSFTQLNSPAVVIILSSSGNVSHEDFAFVFFSLFYMYFIAKVAFPSLNPSKDPQVFNSQSKLLQLYALTGATIGLFTPIANILEGVFEGDKERIKAATPHVFLLASQVFMEGVASSQKFSAPIRALVPAFYNSRRIFSIVDWVRSEVYKMNQEHSGSAWRVTVGRALAMTNMAFWSFNLFGFMFPFYLPKVLKAYYSQNNEKDQ